MADPRQELADIIVPAAPAIVAAEGASLWLVAAVGLAAAAGLAGFVWWWHRRRPMRTLKAISAAVLQQQGAQAELAARLDRWVRKSFQLARVDAAQCPPDLDPAEWFEWAKTLESLRFAPRSSEGYEKLNDLCQTARAWSRHV